ncbi:TIGR03619 family F420-dependent LLM class oxidoreductase [soil metagenome]
MKICLNPFMLETFYGGRPRPVIDLIAMADQKGFDAVVLPEHILMDPNTLDDYPYDGQSAEGRWFDEMTPFFEATTSLAAIASRTENIKLQTGIMLATLRNASVLAKTLTTLDHISEGRVEIGYGVGWLELDYTAEGIPFKGRFGRLVEIAEACQQIWTNAPASYHGEHVNFDGVYSLPFPVQREGIPQWFGIGPSDRNIARMAKAANGWCPLQVPWDVVGETVPKIKQQMEDLGRDPETFGLRLQVIPEIRGGAVDLEATLDTIPTLLEAGATHIEVAALNYVTKPDEFPDFLDACLAARDKNS